VQIDDDDLVGVADVQPARSRIDREIVPTSFSANPNFFEKPIRHFGPGEMNEARGRKSEQRGYGNAKALCVCHGQSPKAGARRSTPSSPRRRSRRTRLDCERISRFGRLTLDFYFLVILKSPLRLS